MTLGSDVRPAGVEGWLTAEQAAVLAAAAAACPADGEIVEIGSFRGLSTIVLATHAPEGAAIVAIDPHAGNDRGPRELDGYRPPRRPPTGSPSSATSPPPECAIGSVTSAPARPMPTARSHGEIDVLYIDGAHRYAAGAGRHPRLGAACDGRRHAARPRRLLVGRCDGGDRA